MFVTARIQVLSKLWKLLLKTTSWHVKFWAALMVLWIHMDVKSEVTKTFVLRRSSWWGGTRRWRTHFCGRCWFCTCVFAPQRFCLRRNLSFIKSCRKFSSEDRICSPRREKPRQYQLIIFITYCHFNSFQCHILINTYTTCHFSFIYHFYFLQRFFHLHCNFDIFQEVLSSLSLQHLPEL